MKIKTTVLIIIAVLVVSVGGTIFVLREVHSSPRPAASTPAPAQQSDNLVHFSAEPDKSVLEQLTGKAVVETKDSQYGLYVDSINGKKNGDGGKYWVFYVDGKLASIGAGEYITKGGENIEWKFE